MPNQFPKKIADITTIPFSIDKSGLYNIIITARTQSSKQDLRIEIDALNLREIPAKDKPQYNNIPSAWNGTELKGLAKTIIFILKLNKGEHTVKFIPNQGAFIDEYKIEHISDSRNILFDLEVQAEAGDRRPWLTFVLIDLPLNYIRADISTQWHFLDGDDVKLIIDNTIKKNPQSIFHKNWIWSASILSKYFGRKREGKTFTENLNNGVHFIEFWADKTPIIHRVELNLGEIELKRIPTVDDPQWTGKFEDDTEAILLARLILGEAERQPKEAKIGVGFTVLNRLKKKNRNWGYSVREIILKDNQYDGMWNDHTYQKVRDPLSDTSQRRKTEWQESYELATGILAGNISDTTNGATNFHSFKDSKDFPVWATKENYKIKFGDIYFYGLEK